jgi:transposase
MGAESERISHPKNQKQDALPLSIGKCLTAGQWILRTGAPWRDLPQEYGSWKTVSSRFYRLLLRTTLRERQKAGIWQQIWSGLQQQADAAGCLDWEVHFGESTVVRAHQHAAGSKRGSKTLAKR